MSGWSAAEAVLAAIGVLALIVTGGWLTIIGLNDISRRAARRRWERRLRDSRLVPEPPRRERGTP